MDSEKRRLFVGGISWETSEVALREHFSKYGEWRLRLSLISVLVMEEGLVITDKRTGHGRGFGFAVFKDPDRADQALQDEHVILNRKVLFLFLSPALYKLSKLISYFWFSTHIHERTNVVLVLYCSTSLIRKKQLL